MKLGFKLQSTWGAVYVIEPNGHTIQKQRFEPKDIFTSKEEAEAHGIKLAKEKALGSEEKALGSGLLILISALAKSWIHGAPATD